MANTLKDLAASLKLVGQDALERSLTELKIYIDAQDTAGSSAIAAVDAKLDALIGAAGGDADKILNTFNEIKEFLADYDEDDTLKSLLDAVNSAISAETTRAQTAEQANATAISGVSARVTTLENINIMTSNEAKAIFDDVFSDEE